MKTLIIHFSRYLLLLVLASPVQATVVSIGAFTTDDASTNSIITDSLNNYEWLRWDVLAGLTYAETVDAITTGSFKGWKIAHSHEAQLFVNAYLYPVTPYSPCTEHGYEVSCGFLPDWYDGILGDNGSTYPPGDQEDFAYFLSDTPSGEEVGAIDVDWSHGMYAALGKQNDLMSIATADASQDPSVPHGLQISWLLYKDLNVKVPEPTTILLLGIGLVGLGLSRRKKAS